MKFAVLNNLFNSKNENIAEDIVNECLEEGDSFVISNEKADYILNFFDFRNPKACRRHSKDLIVISFVIDNNPVDQDVKALCYNTLIRSLSNLLIYIAPSQEVFFTTPEAGFYQIFFNPKEIYEKMRPIISSHFATENNFFFDLPKKYRNGSFITDSISHYGKVMDKLGVLPVPFPLKDFLTDLQLNHIYKIYGITGASYGNLSARENIKEVGDNTFWMTGRGVNKSSLQKIGKDILLVKGFDLSGGTAFLSMPDDFNPTARVSVDAIEHYMIYSAFPQVGAIVHVHAWMDNILCTSQNYPCGTVELAREVTEMLHHADEPGRAVIGLKNHGLTITGENLEEIFNRVEGKLLTQVEMFA